MLWHRQKIFESKEDKMSSSVECGIRIQDESQNWQWYQVGWMFTDHIDGLSSSSFSSILDSSVGLSVGIQSADD